MAAPFWQHPRFGEYIAHAVSKQCKVQCGYRNAPNGKPVAITKITAPDGRWVIEAGTSQDEHLAPSEIARLDRRTGLSFLAYWSAKQEANDQ